MPHNELNELRDRAHRFLLEADRPVETPHIARQLFGPQRHEMPEAQVVVRSLLDPDPRFLRTHCRRWSARWAPHLQQTAMDADYVAVDLETTGSVIGVDQIMEVGVVRLAGDREIDRFTTRVRTDRGIPPWVSRLTGISEADLAGAPRFAEVAPRLVELLDGAVFVAHDIRFDLPFLRWTLLEHDLAFPCVTGLCTLQLSRALWPDLPSHSLGELAVSLDLCHDQPHRAGDDALAAAGILQRALRLTAGVGSGTQGSGTQGLSTLGDLMELEAGVVSTARRTAES